MPQRPARPCDDAPLPCIVTDCIEAFHRAALEAGGKDNGPPGLRPHYHATYYAAFVIGPDGHNIEVVCHEPEA